MGIADHFVPGMLFLEHAYIQVDFGIGTMQLYVGNCTKLVQIQAKSMLITWKLNKTICKQISAYTVIMNNKVFAC